MINNWELQLKFRVLDGQDMHDSIYLNKKKKEEELIQLAEKHE